jgi:hypothetical protein
MDYVPQRIFLDIQISGQESKHPDRDAAFRASKCEYRGRFPVARLLRAFFSPGFTRRYKDLALLGLSARIPCLA